MTPLKPMRVIWSAMHTGSLEVEHFLRVIDRAAAEGVSGVELSGNTIDRYVGYRDCPEIAAKLDRAKLAERQDAMRRMADRAAERGLRFGVWHHEISGSRGGDLLELLPELRAADGLIDLDSPRLYRLITDRAAEFFDLYPTVDELILTLTETAYPVMHRPFCPIPPAERIRRVIQSLLDVTEPRGKQLVIRPFSALREDELAVREAVQSLRAQSVSMMYKTEPFDWHPFLPDEELIGSVPRYEARAETDAGAEYYGQGVFPCCYTRHIERRFTAAAGRGATVAIVRVDRGAHHPALDHPINEANVIAPTRWLMNPDKPLEAHWQDWLHERHGVRDPELYNVLERTFDVIKGAFYIDGHALSHHLMPSLEHAKHIQVFSLFEPHVPLTHLARNWGALPDRTAPSHHEIIAEKQRALDLAWQLVEQFERHSPAMPEASRRAIGESLQRLPVLAEACLAVCRLFAAHVAEMLRLPEPATRDFDAEAADTLALADRIEKRYGLMFFPHLRLGPRTKPMVEALRDVVSGLRDERQLEIPLRRELEAQPGLVDYVLCGFAAEGHRLKRRVHAGDGFRFGDRFVRASGTGINDAFGYTLRGRPGKPLRLRITFADDGAGRPGIVNIAGREHAFDLGRFHGFQSREWSIPAGPSAELAVEFWSTTPSPCWVSSLEVLE